MKKLKTYIWLVAVVVVAFVICTKPQYAEEAARAFMLLLGEQQCGCE